MAKQVRLKSAEHREWNNNIPVLVNSDGVVERQMVPPEINAFEQLKVLIRGKSRNKIPTLQVEVKGRESSAVKVSITDKTIQYTLDGMVIMGGRDALCARMIAMYGDCTLRRPNGHILKVLRDPNVQRPVAADALRTAPKPESCVCVGWGAPHPGKHHPVCEWNAKAPPDEQAELTPGDERSMSNVPMQTSKVRVLPTELVQVTRPQNPVVEVKATPAPDDCVCNAWVPPNGGTKEDGQHHPICQYYEEWKRHTKPKQSLVNMTTGEVLRDATEAEIGEAEVEERRSGAKMVKIGEDMFGVVNKEEAARAVSDTTHQ